MKPLISIITINRNEGEGLEKTIKSIISQTFRNFEYIVIDGNSTDNSVPIIEKHADYIDYWVSEPDTGVFNAMNKGIKKARGKYCLFLNSNDYLVDELMLEDVFSGKEYDAPFITGHQINDFGNYRNRSKAQTPPLSLFTFFANTIKHQATFIRRDLFDTYGYYSEELSIVSDWKFFLEVIALHNEQPIVVDRDIVIFKWFGLSTNEKTKLTLEKERKKVLEELLPMGIRRDYIQFQEMSQYNYVSSLMKNSPSFSLIVRYLVKIFK